MHRISTLVLGTLLAFGGSAAFAADAPAKPAASKQAPAKAKAGSSRQALKSEAKGLALGTETAEAVSANQLDIAQRVLTGQADCEFNQSVSVNPVAEQPGTFRVAFKNNSYMMVPEETSTGAVRLVDRNAGVVWLQIPVKSMLMNNKIGQRMVDACLHAEQRAAVNAASGMRKVSTLQ